MDKQFQIKEWARLYGRHIAEEEYCEICNNLTRFFELLIEADKTSIDKAQR